MREKPISAAERRAIEDGALLSAPPRRPGDGRHPAPFAVVMAMLFAAVFWLAVIAAGVIWFSHGVCR